MQYVSEHVSEVRSVIILGSVYSISNFYVDFYATCIYLMNDTRTEPGMKSSACFLCV